MDKILVTRSKEKTNVLGGKLVSLEWSSVGTSE